MSEKQKANHMATIAEQVILEAKTFKSGSVGFWGGGKVVFDGERYQVSLSAVKIGSKPAAK